MIETRSKRLRPIFGQFKGAKRKLLETLLYNAESDSWDKTRLAKEIGVTRTTLYAYMADPELMNALKLCTTILYGVEIPHTVRNILTLSKSEDSKEALKANELLIRMSGMIDSGNRQTVNVVNQPGAEPTYIDDPVDALALLEAEQAERAQLIEQVRTKVRERIGTQGDGMDPKKDA